MIGKATAEFEAEEGYDPEGRGGAQIGPHDHADGFDDREESRVDETDHHDGRGGRGLHHAGDQKARADAGDAIAGHRPHERPKAIAGELLQGLGHDFHAKEEHAEGAEDFEKGADHVGKKSWKLDPRARQARPCGANFLSRVCNPCERGPRPIKNPAGQPGRVWRGKEIRGPTCRV